MEEDESVTDDISMVQNGCEPIVADAIADAFRGKVCASRVGLPSL